MKKVVIAQFFGLGDIIWAQSIAHHFINQGYEVEWPVEPHFLYQCQRAYPKILFTDRTKCIYNLDDKRDYEENGIRHLPLRYAEYLLGRPYKDHMKSKYDYVGLNWQDWKLFAYPFRDSVKEIELMNLLGVADGEEYNFVSGVFGSNAHHSVPIKRNDGGLKDVEMIIVPGYTIFDWCRIIENATNIHAVSSSTLYLFELLDLKAKSLHLYRRSTEKDFSYTQFLYTKGYQLHL